MDRLGLIPTGMTKTHGVHGERDVETYLVAVWLPNQVVFGAVPVSKGEMGAVEVLIGMDIIAAGDFAVTHAENNRTMMSFRVPSSQKIDFVLEAQAEKAEAARKALIKQRPHKDRKKPKKR